MGTPKNISGFGSLVPEPEPNEISFISVPATFYSKLINIFFYFTNVAR